MVQFLLNTDLMVQNKGYRPTFVNAISPIPSRKDWSFEEKLTNKGKVKRTIYKFYSFKSAGLDGIFPALLKEGLDLLLARLTSIFKSSIALGHIPKLWQKVRVVFIPKPGRSSHGVAKLPAD